MYDIKVKKIAPIQVASKKASVDNFENSGELNMTLFREVRQHIVENGAGMPAYDIALYHGIPGQTELTLEAAIPVNDTLAAIDTVEQLVLDAVEEMASVIHYGSYQTIHLAHMAIQGWMQENNYMPVGAVRDVYLVFDPEGDPAKNVTELQYPVRKLG